MAKTVYTAEDSTVFINFEGHNKPAADIVDEINRLMTVSAISKTRESKKIKTLKGDELAYAGTLSYSDIEFKILLNDETKAQIAKFDLAVNDVSKNEVSIKMVMAWGETFTGNLVITGIDRPESNPDNVVEVTVKAAISGVLVQS